MEIRILIVHNNLQYALGLAKALVAINKFFKIRITKLSEFSMEKHLSYIAVSPYKEIFEAYKLQGILLPGETEAPMAVTELAQRLLALHWGSGLPQRLCKWQNCKATAFISAYGGSGKTASAVCYGRHLARFAGGRPALVSLDPAGRNGFPAGIDSYGLCFLRPASQSRAAAVSPAGEPAANLPGKFTTSLSFGSPAFSAEDFFRAVTNLIETEGYTHIILDIPSEISFQPYIDMCENRVVVYGWYKNRYRACDALFAALEQRGQLLGQANAKNFKLLNSYDQKSFQNNVFGDIYGQLGKEISELAGKLETK